MAWSTRSQDRHSVFGHPKALDQDRLPLAEDVFRAYRFHQTANSSGNINDLVKLVATEVRDLYVKASLPTIELDSVVKKVKRLVQKINELSKYSEKKRSSVSYQENITKLSTLFDICTCKCVDNGILERENCMCPLDQKIPKLEWEFWIDQKSLRRMVIGKLDTEVTEKKRLSEERKLKRCKYEDTKRNENLQVVSLPQDSTSSGEDSTTEELFFSETEETNEYNTQNRNQYPELCKALERTNVSNRNACLIINAALKDLGLLSPSNAVDSSKLQRQRKLYRDKLSQQHLQQHEGMVCIGFDGKIDETLVCDGNIKRKAKEEHYVLVSFPEASYVDHVAPKSGKSSDISSEIQIFLQSTKSAATLRAVVCDGTPVNTGYKNGVIRQLESYLHRPLQWLICMLHCNELPLRQLFSVVDGKTTGPKSNEGPISKALLFDPQDKPIINFAPIPGYVVTVPEPVAKDFSSDQLYLLRICLLVQQGIHSECNITFLHTGQPGTLSHARWLTKANRLLRLYVSDRNPSDELKHSVKFVVSFYAPVWFHIKSHPTCQDGAKNFYFMVSLYQKLSTEDQAVIAPVLLNNCYFSHPENVLLAGVADELDSIRIFSCQQILRARTEESTNTEIRCFDKRQFKVNLSATSYMELLDWTSTPITSPPLLDNISDDCLANYQQIILPKYPCHSVDVEINVKDLSAVCQRVFGHSSRHGAVLQMKKSRLEIPVIHTKADFL